MSGTTRNLRDATVFIEDGSPVPNQMEVPLSEGDLKFTQKDNSFTVFNRGKIDSRKAGDEATLDLSLTLKYEQWGYRQGVTGLSPIDVLQGSQLALNAGWVNSDPCGPYAVTLRFRMYNPCNRSQYEDLVFTKVHITEFAFAEGSEYNTVALKGEALQGKVTPTFTV